MDSYLDGLALGQKVNPKAEVWKFLWDQAESIPNKGF